MQILESAEVRAQLLPLFLHQLERRPYSHFKAHYCAHSDAGLVRIKNQDAWKVGCDQRFFVLADGIGGRRAGEIAAQNAVDALCYFVEQMAGHQRRTTLAQLCELMQRGIEQTNDQIYEMGCRDDRRRGMGTTLCSLFFEGDRAIYTHVGDSRIYHWRQGQLRQLTKDHTKNHIGQWPWSAQNELASPRSQLRTILTRALGVRPRVLPAIDTCRLRPRDRFLMCSDGLSDVLTSSQIEQTLSTATLTQKTARALIDSAKDKNSRDNITVVLIEVTAPHGGDLL